MADNYREANDVLDPELDEDRVRDLDPNAAPDAVGVYDRPEKTGPGLSVAAIIGIIALLVIAVFVVAVLL